MQNKNLKANLKFKVSLTKSKIFLIFCLSFVFGVFAASFIKISPAVLGGFFIFGLALAIVFWIRDKRIVLFGFCLMLFALGLFRYLQKEEIGNLKLLNEKGRLEIIGKISEPPDRRAASQKIRIEAEKIIFNSKKDADVSGSALATVKLYPEFNYGDRLRISGKLQTPQNLDEFDYQKYLAKSDIFSVLYYPEINILEKNKGNKIKQALFWLKARFDDSINQILPEPQASFLTGLLLGEKKQISPELTEAFKQTGTTHIVALSGYNISLVCSFFMTIFGLMLLGRNFRFWLSVLAIVLFTILVGASASVVRASIMGILILLARNQGRLHSIKNALVFAGAAMIFFNPKILRFDIGFQLSFLATAGLIWLAPVFEKWLAKAPKLFLLKEIFIATMAAQIAVLPLLLVYFGRLSLVSPLANLFVLLLVPFSMFFGFLAGGLGLIWLFGGKIVGWLVWSLLTAKLWIINFFADLPFASVDFSWNWLPAILYYLILAGLLFIFYRKKSKEILVEQWAEE
ncbi:MAG: ComEC/Rec2 family competence protein [Candidatus Portnoybacteria bacterium]|nr:ComEC/Rec2 family competence protein [Candidatus Portnoybacteria bacterium]